MEGVEVCSGTGTLYTLCTDDDISYLSGIMSDEDIESSISNGAVIKRYDKDAFEGKKVSVLEEIFINNSKCVKKEVSFFYGDREKMSLVTVENKTSIKFGNKVEVLYEEGEIQRVKARKKKVREVKKDNKVSILFEGKEVFSGSMKNGIDDLLSSLLNLKDVYGGRSYDQFEESLLKDCKLKVKGSKISSATAAPISLGEAARGA